MSPHLSQGQNTDVSSVFSEDDEAFTLLTSLAGGDAVSSGAFNLDWCLQRGRHVCNFDVIQPSAENPTLPPLLRPCVVSLLLIGYLRVNDQLEVVLTAACWNHEITVCISPFPHAYLHGKAVWIKHWTYLPAGESGHFEVYLNDIERLGEKTRLPILNSPSTLNQLTGIIRALSWFSTASKTSFFVEVTVLKPRCESSGVYNELESDETCIVVMQRTFLKYWPMLAEGVVINFSGLSVFCVPKHAHKIILTTSRGSELVPHPANIVQTPFIDIVTHKPAAVSINELSFVSKEPHRLKPGLITYEGKISLRRKDLILLDGLFVMRIGMNDFSHVQACLRVGAHVKISWVMLIWNRKDAELLKTARTSIAVTAFSSEPTSTAAYAIEGPFRFFPESLHNAMFAKFVESCMMSKFSMLAPGGAGFKSGEKCDLHHILFGCASNIGLVTAFEQLSEGLASDARRLESADMLDAFLNPAAGLAELPMIPCLKKFQLTFAAKARERVVIPQNGKDTSDFHYATEGHSACHRCGGNVASCNIYPCNSRCIMLVGILHCTGARQRSLSLTDDSGSINVICKNGIPPEYIGALVSLYTFAIAANAKGKLESVVVELESIQILMNGPNAAAQPHLAKGFTFPRQMSGPMRLTEYRICRSLKSIEGVSVLCWGEGKTATEAVWSSKLLCVLVKNDHVFETRWEIEGHLVAICRARSSSWSPTRVVIAAHILRLRISRPEAHRPPALEAGKPYSFSCPLASFQQLNCHFKQFLQSPRYSPRAGDLVIDYEQLPNIGSVGAREVNLCRSILPASKTGTLSTWDGYGDGGLCSNVEALNITPTCMTCDPLWTALYAERCMEESTQLVKLVGTVECLSPTSEGVCLTIRDNELQLVSVDVTIRNTNICSGVVLGMKIALNAVRRHINGETTILFEDSEGTSIVLLSTFGTTLCKPCGRNSRMPIPVLSQTFPPSSFQDWANKEGSLRWGGGCRSVRLRIRKLLRLEFGKDIKREESAVSKSVCICGQAQRPMTATFLADDGSCQIEMSTTDACEIFYLLGVSSKLLPAIERLESCYCGGTVTENVAKDAASFSSLQNEWRIIYKQFLKRSFRPIKVFVRTLSIPQISVSFTRPTARFARVVIERKDFWTCTWNSVPTTQMLGVLVLEGICHGRIDDRSCYRRRSVPFLDYLDCTGVI